MQNYMRMLYDDFLLSYVLKLQYAVDLPVTSILHVQYSVLSITCMEKSRELSSFCHKIQYVFNGLF
jgi:hypothetical protein